MPHHRKEYPMPCDGFHHPLRSVSWGLHISISKWLLPSWKSIPRLHITKLSSSTSSMKWWYQQAWLAGKNAPMVLLRNAWENYLPLKFQILAASFLLSALSTSIASTRIWITKHWFNGNHAKNLQIQQIWQGMNRRWLKNLLERGEQSGEENPKSTTNSTNKVAKIKAIKRRKEEPTKI